MAVRGDQESNTGIYSDDFSKNDGSGEDGLGSWWTYYDPVAPASVGVSHEGQGTSDAFVVIDVDSGDEHDTWYPLTALQLYQDTNDVDLEIVASFESIPGAPQYEICGIYAQDSVAGYHIQVVALRLTASSELKINIDRCDNSPTSWNNVGSGTVDQSPSTIQLHLDRTGDVWLARWGTDGGGPTNMSGGTLALNIDRVGILTGNAAAENAFTNKVDYFWEDRESITIEDPLSSRRVMVIT